MKNTEKEFTREELLKYKKELSSIIGSFKRSVPELKVDIIEKEVFSIFKSLTHCQLTGLPLSHRNELSLVIIDPLEIKKEININNVLFISNNIKKFWNDLHSFLLSDTNSQEHNFYKDLLTRLTFVKNTIQEKSKVKNFCEIDLEKIINTNKTIPERILNLQCAEETRLLHKKLHNADLSVFVHPKEKKYLYNDKEIIAKVRGCRQRSLDKGFTCDLTFKNAKFLFKIDHCQLTGLPITKFTSNVESKSLCFSLDRINRFEGYNLSNILVIAQEANEIKSYLERENYTENVDTIRYILEKTKSTMLKRHSYDALENRVTPMSIDDIMKHYLSKRKNEKRCVFNIK